MKHRSLLGLTGALALVLSVSACGGHANADPSSPASPGVAVASPTPAPFATPPVLSGTPDVATLVQRVKPAVVNVTVVHEVRGERRMSMPFDPFGSPLDRFFGRTPRGGGGDDDGDVPSLKQRGLGSGFLIDKAGHVLTNAHVIDGADAVKVKLADDREFDAKVVGKDLRLDVALLALKNPPSDLPTVSLGASDALKVGEYVVAIGNPFGLGDTVTMGIVSAKGRVIGAGDYDDFIQTDASINPGNSGGPLFDLRGQVVGMNTAINPNGRGIGFAIPIDEMKEVLPQLLASGHVTRGMLGVTVQPVDPALAKALGMDNAKGALIGEVEADGPGARSGLRAGDVILSVDGRAIGKSRELPRQISRHTPGSKVKLEVMRDRKTESLDVTLGALPDKGKDEATADEARPHALGAATELGVVLGESSEGPVVERIVPGSAAEDELLPGDVIVEVNRVHVGRANEAAKQLQASAEGGAVLLKVKRQGRTLFVALERK